MDEKWIFNMFQLPMFVMLLFYWNLGLCFSLNSEGLALLRLREGVVRVPFGALSNWVIDDAVTSPCSWKGVECLDGKVVTLNLKDLCLEGTLTPEVAKLTRLKSINLRNNCFSGEIPVEIRELKELEILDLGYNNFSGPFPHDIGSNLSLTTLLLDHNDYLGGISPELYELQIISESHVDEERLTGAARKASCNCRSKPQEGAAQSDTALRKLLQVAETVNPHANERSENIETVSLSPSPSAFLPSSVSAISVPPSKSSSDSPFSPEMSLPSPSPLESPGFIPSASPSTTFLIPSPSPGVAQAPSPDSPVIANPPTIAPAPSPSNLVPVPSPSSIPSQTNERNSKSKHYQVIIWATVGGFCLFTLVSAIAYVFCRSAKVVTVKPWVTGLSGQLQKAFVTGVPSLKRSEIEAACEDFSNIIGSFYEGTVYKGTLSSGVEIAVTSTAVCSSEKWSKNKEVQFRKKIGALSRINHKNFVNLIGYCEQQDPFTRMMVFEYAPNGTLFEHLHVKETEHLDWSMRLRIAMGMAYCLEHMHQLTPPLAHRNLQSSSVYLTEDYAAKISDFSFLNDIAAAKLDSLSSLEFLALPSANPESNVYNFGVILFEMITGKMPYSVDNGPHDDWASEYLRRAQPLREMVDPTLQSFKVEELDKLYQLINDCVNPIPQERPTMKEVTARLKEITWLEANAAIPKLSPLWWAELEIMSAEIS